MILINSIKKLLGLHIHIWSKWATKNKHVTSDLGDYDETVQVRICTTCDMLKVREVN